jgi:alpha-L-rhamnosidase
MSYDSPYGRIQLGWEMVGHRFELELVVPVGVTATVELPDGTILPGIEHGRYTYAVDLEVATAVA